MTHVKHLGFELELAALRIVKAIECAPDDQRDAVVQHLAPKGLRLAVADMLEAADWADPARRAEFTRGDVSAAHARDERGRTVDTGETDA